MKDLIKYRAFAEAARTGSLTAAAFSLNYTQPGISHLIAVFEKECGFRLFFRNKKGVKLTDDGERIYRICRELLDKHAELTDTISSINGKVIGTLRIGCYLSVLTRLGNALIERMAKLHPHLKLIFTEGNQDVQLSLLERNEIDVGIFSSSAPENYKFIPIIEDSIVVILPHQHELCDKEIITKEDLLDSDMLIYSEGSERALVRVFGDRYYAVKNRLITKNDQAQLRLVESGLGIGVVAKW